MYWESRVPSKNVMHNVCIFGALESCKARRYSPSIGCARESPQVLGEPPKSKIESVKRCFI